MENDTLAEKLQALNAPKVEGQETALPPNVPTDSSPAEGEELGDGTQAEGTKDAHMDVAGGADTTAGDGGDSGAGGGEEDGDLGSSIDSILSAFDGSESPEIDESDAQVISQQGGDSMSVIDRHLESAGIKRDGLSLREAIDRHVRETFSSTFGIGMDIVQAVQDGILEPNEVLSGALDFSFKDAYDPNDMESVRAYARESLREDGMSDEEISEYFDEASDATIKREARRYLSTQQDKREKVAATLAQKIEQNKAKVAARKEAAVALASEIAKATKGGFKLHIGEEEVQLTPAQAQRLGRIAMNPEAINTILWGGENGSTKQFLSNLASIAFGEVAVKAAKRRAASAAADQTFKDLSNAGTTPATTQAGAAGGQKLHPLRAAIQKGMNTQ